MSATRARSLHRLGVICGLAAGAWLGAAEVPTKLVTTRVSPFVVSLGMVSGVFLGRWTLPTLLKGGAYLIRDIRRKPHLIVWAILAGAVGRRQHSHGFCHQERRPIDRISVVEYQ